MDNDHLKQLHVYGQHDKYLEVVITGSEESLIQLRDAINKALKNKKGISVTSVVDSRNQEYDVMVVINKDLSHLRLPSHLESEGLDPWDSLTPEQQEVVQEYWDIQESRWSSHRIRKKSNQNDLINKIKKIFSR